MPGNLSVATVYPSSTVLPQGLCTSFVESNLYPMLSNDYHDGTSERSLIVDGVNPSRSCRTWKLGRRLTTAQLTALRTFWETAVFGGLNPFYFYSPFDVLPGAQVGSNWDPTGANIQGRAIVVFGGNWSESTDLGRNNIPSLQLVEVA